MVCSPDTTRDLGAAVVGLGVGEQHARAFGATPGCRLRWLYDVDSARTAAVLSRLDEGAAAGGLSTILDDPATHIVSIASYDHAHYEQVTQCLAALKHVFVEKPLCRSFAELCAVKSAWIAAGRHHLQSNLVLRAAPMYQWLKAAIRAGEFGVVYAFDGDYLYGRLEKIASGWRGRVPDYSVMQGGGVHLVDLMMWLTDQRPMSVFAAGNRICTAETAFRYRDFVAAQYQFESGLVGRITANFGCVHRHQHVVRVFGTRATFIYDDAGARVHRTRDPSERAESSGHEPLPRTKGDLIGGFVGAIRRREDPAPGAQHEFDVISACLAADEACARNQLIKVTYV
jgi:predicted dehydrogenase